MSRAMPLGLAALLLGTVLAAGALPAAGHGDVRIVGQDDLLDAAAGGASPVQGTAAGALSQELRAAPRWGAEQGGWVAPSPRAGPQPALATTSSYSIAFECPGDLLGAREAPCPLRVVDEDDLLGGATVAINPQNMQYIAFASLHGTLEDGPTRRSRGSQTHTTFVHTGLPASLAFPPFQVRSGWSDQPYFPPNEISRQGNVVLGEDVHAIIDPQGNLYISSLYAVRESGDANASWAFRIATWKFDPELEQLNYDFPNEVFEPRAANRSIEMVWNRYLEGREEVVSLWRERGPPVPVAPPERGNGTGNGTEPQEPPQEPPGEPGNATGEDGNATAAALFEPGPAWLTGATTPADLFSGFTALPDGLSVGPCRTTTEPVSFDGRMYVGCVAAEGYDALPGVAPGDLMIHELDFDAGAQRVLSKAPVAGQPALAVGAGGRMALVGVEVVDNRTVQVQLSTGRLGQGWTGPHTIDGLHDANRTVREARVNALLYRAPTNTVHMVYVEEAGEEDRQLGLPSWRKSLVVTDAIGAVLVAQDLDINDKGEVFEGGGRSAPRGPGAYADLRDSLIEVNGREFLLFTDWAVYVFAEIVETDAREDSIVFENAPPPPEPVPVIEPAPAVVQVGTGVVAAAVAAEAIRRAAGQRLATGAGRGRR